MSLVEGNEKWRALRDDEERPTCLWCDRPAKQGRNGRWRPGCDKHSASGSSVDYDLRRKLRRANP